MRRHLFSTSILTCATIALIGSALVGPAHGSETTPRDTTGTVTVDGATVTTRGPWIAPAGSECIDLLLDYDGFTDTTEYEDYTVVLVRVDGRPLPATTLIKPYRGAPAAGTTSMQFCPNGEDPLNPTEPITLKLTTPSGGTATGAPFEWTTEPIVPPTPSPLPATTQLGEVTVTTTGNWIKPATTRSVSQQESYSYLYAYTGLPVGESLFVKLIDARTREQYLAFSGNNPSWLPEFGSGFVAVSLYVYKPPPESFYVQISTQAGDIAETGPYTWDSSAPAPVPPKPQPQAVALGPMTITPTGHWGVPAYCGEVLVAYTGRPNDWTYITASVIDATTREVLGIAQSFDYSESATMPIRICARVTAQTPLILQFESEAGVVESAPFRWEGTAVTPGQVRTLKATVPKQKGRVTLRWQAPANATAAGVTAYEYRVNAGPWTSTPRMNVTVSRLPSKKVATFVVRAVAGDLRGPEARVTARPR